jgi:hypothetical protein
MAFAMRQRAVAASRHRTTPLISLHIFPALGSFTKR